MAKAKQQQQPASEPVLVQLRKIGGSLGVVIPKTLVEELGLSIDTFLWIRRDASRGDALQLVIAQVSPPD